MERHEGDHVARGAPGPRSWWALVGAVAVPGTDLLAQVLGELRSGGAVAVRSEPGTAGRQIEEDQFGETASTHDMTALAGGAGGAGRAGQTRSRLPDRRDRSSAAVSWPIPLWEDGAMAKRVRARPKSHSYDDEAVTT
jgi:hypothetical protein